ncbi:hypothetical protein K3495_g14105 [Podosphaera aphanis]|nr:hypothetical protein K3495_g14105 [Podosphaera aphanis]
MRYEVPDPGDWNAPRITVKKDYSPTDLISTSANYLEHIDEPRESVKQYVPSYPEKRRPQKRALSAVDQAEINKWFSKSGVKIGSLQIDQKDLLTRLLYTYQDLNSTDLENLPCTDLSMS